ncbi:PREDICTED: inhibitor of Bruton tyrosine kinase isoform X1 [Drosophila arizonae]|uniref:Inhibitor of Bruton tyrosine kinase isoform X1 n=2 Tax=Drosophila arizonae TaxID=7263 RepID=A0ABM1PGT5_DROAR|nr:PREDICTED: inhibitor of Bruton tyrosine kinase isoform X1 [Drosophila arizonae]XP_017866422.1 PREDICTED: inhibitor of Bruton tyrosine kinase isoform X1 [Drosophila arizonae]
MSALRNHEYDCTAKCRQRQHGNCITAALTKRSIDDQKLATFIAKTCANFCNIPDYLGRTAVHMCASVARYRILEWLLNQGALVNERDWESGFTPLHRALFYGSIDCAVLLLRYGGSLEVLDEDTRCPLQAICRKCDQEQQVESQNEALVWGSNRNYNLGIGNEQNTLTPQSLDFFRKSNLWLEQVALGPFHSLFLDKRGHLYAVGHGKGGRLGIGVENSLPAPKRVKVPLKHNEERIVGISVSRQHSLLLTNRSLVFACGLNDQQQLGVRDAGDYLTTFKEVVALRDKGASQLLRVIACDQHSIAYSAKAVYVWGANQGQFGISANTKIIAAPTLLKLADRTCIRFVEANNAATVVYTEEKLILLFYADKPRTIKTPNYEHLKSISLMGGHIKNSTKGSAAALKLLMLTETNVVFLWYENTQQFYRCVFSPVRMPQIKRILYKCNQVLLLSMDGCVYRGKCHQLVLPAISQEKSRPNLDIWQNNDQHRTEISREHYIRIDLQRVPNVDRVVDIVCDESFVSFAVLQESHMKYFRKPALPRREHSFKKLYHDTSEADAVHDLVFHVDGERYAAHKFIIFGRAPGLRELIRNYLDKDVYLNFENLTGKMFELVLKHIYTNYWPTEEDIDCMQQSLGPSKPAQRNRVCEMFHAHLEKFQLHELAKYVNNYLTEQQFPMPPRQRFHRLQRSQYPELYDVRIVCEDNQLLEAHKCILVARLEYFEMMFMHSWAERTTVHFDGVPFEYLEPVLDYLYSLDTEAFCKQNYTETFLYNMITLCDQYFIESLQNVCESLILDKISIRKCGEMLEFATMYNCKLLQQGCLDFICQNLARVLCYRSIEQCEPNTLQRLNDHYRRMFQSVFDYRQITPFSEAIEDELLLSFVDGCEVDLDYRMDAEAKLKEATKQKQKELHNKQDARHYEQQAISSMMRSLSLSKTATPAQATTTTTSPESAPNETKNWSRVVDKKEQKRKQAETAVKVNNVLKQEVQPTPELVPISPRATSTKEATPPPQSANSSAECSTPLSKSYNLDLSSLMPQSAKLSQKQRKRLCSESQSWRAPVELNSSTPVAVPNAWGVTASSPNSSYAEPFSSPAAAPTGSSADPTSFANMMRGGQVASPPEAGNSFSQILADERRQRDSYERMRNKSLVHTQIEETAIAELREFYNVDNIDDETITIERKSRPSNINFTTWLKH